MRRTTATLAALAAAGLAVLLTAAPAQAADPHYATGQWQLRDFAGPYPDVETSPASESSTDCAILTLVKPDVDAQGEAIYGPSADGDIGTSYENTNLGLAVSAGDVLTVDYDLSDSANADNGAVRMFVYDTADADTLNTAPLAFVAATSTAPSQMSITFAADTTIGTFGLTYDASNDTEGWVTFTNLTLISGEAGTPISPCAAPQPTEPAPSTSTTGGGLAQTGTNLTWLVVGAVALLVIGSVAVLSFRRRRAHE